MVVHLVLVLVLVLVESDEADFIGMEKAGQEESGCSSFVSRV